MTLHQELTSRLNDLGYKTTQATVSRDVKHLRLRKVPTSGGQKYVFPGGNPVGREKYHRIFQDGLISIEPAGTIVVIKTISGMAMAVAAALDELKLEQIVGSIAGDDTIMCACRSVQDAELLISKLNSYQY